MWNALQFGVDDSSLTESLMLFRDVCQYRSRVNDRALEESSVRSTTWNALQFGVDDSVEIGTANELGLNLSFSVSCWFLILRFNTEDSGDNTIIGSGGQCHEYSTIHLITRNRKLYFGFYCNDTAGNHILDTNVWYHSAFVYDAETKSQRIYLNGKLDAEGMNKCPLRGNSTVFISKYADASRGLNGRLASLRIDREALCPEAVWDHFSAAVSIESLMLFRDVCQYRSRVHDRALEESSPKQTIATDGTDVPLLDIVEKNDDETYDIVDDEGGKEEEESYQIVDDEGRKKGGGRIFPNSITRDERRLEEESYQIVDDEGRKKGGGRI